jgi:hypothetical protein
MGFGVVSSLFDSKRKPNAGITDGSEIYLRPRNAQQEHVSRATMI